MAGTRAALRARRRAAAHAHGASSTFGLTTERVRQIELGSLRKLRACPASTSLGIVRAEGVTSTGFRVNPIGHLFNARRAIIVVVTVEGRYLTNFRDDLTRDTLQVNFRIPPGVSLIRFKPHIPRHFSKRAGRGGPT